MLWLRYSTYGFWVEMGGMHMSARNHEVTAKQQLLDANGNIAETVLDAFPMGKLQMPTNSSEGDIVYEKKNLRLKYVLEKNPENLSERSVVGKSIAGKEKTGRNIIIRHIICEFDNFYQGKPFSCDIRLQQPQMDTMVIATPWDKKGRFYYNQKINCMRAEGFAEYGCFMFCGEGAQPVLNVKNTLIHMKKCNIIH